ncbi:hypothetical protein Amsp01_040540 [Amycolatopsis sp. NBRC 101858]|nr:hypothetical protein Amsp01_040540 [Amycolatopsis sp. NBRC 101858]
MLALCGGCSGDGTYEVELVVSVEGAYRAGSFDVGFSAPGTTTSEGGKPDGPVWRKTVDVASPPANVLLLTARADPDSAADSSGLWVTCTITVDGEERAKETDHRFVSCAVDMYEVTGGASMRPAPPPAGGLWGWLGALLGVVAILAAGAVILRRTRRPGPRPRAEPPRVPDRRPEPDPVLEPQIRFLHLCALFAVLAIGVGVFAACSTTPELPPGLRVPSAPPARNGG